MNRMLPNVKGVDNIDAKITMLSVILDNSAEIPKKMFRKNSGKCPKKYSDSLITPSGNARGCEGNARNGVRDRGGVGHASGRAPRVAASVFCRQVSAVRSTIRQGWKSIFVHISENFSRLFLRLSATFFRFLCYVFYSHR